MQAHLSLFRDTMLPQKPHLTPIPTTALIAQPHRPQTRPPRQTPPSRALLPACAFILCLRCANRISDRLHIRLSRCRRRVSYRSRTPRKPRHELFPQRQIPLFALVALHGIPRFRCLGLAEWRLATAHYERAFSVAVCSRGRSGGRLGCRLGKRRGGGVCCSWCVGM
jgi:hypothetical protein